MPFRTETWYTVLMLNKEYHWQLSEGDSSYLAVARQERTDAKSFSRHCHSDYEIYCFEEGSGSFILENAKILLSPGDCIFIRPNEYHYLEAYGDCPYTRTVVNLSEKLIRSRGLAPAIERLAGKSSPFFNLNDAPALTRLLKQPISLDGILPEAELCEYAACLVSQFLFELSVGEYPRTEETMVVSDITRRIIAFINSNIAMPLSVDTIAKELYISKSYAANRFLSEMHIGVMQFVRSKKMLHAKQLLESGVKPHEVCYRCGYDDYTTFYRTFKKVIGCAPSEVRSF